GSGRMLMRYQSANGPLAALFSVSSSGISKLGDGNPTNPRSCAWSPAIREVAFPVGSRWSVNSSCSVPTAEGTSALRLVESSWTSSVQTVSISGHSMRAVVVHRTGELTVTFSSGKQVTDFTEDVLWSPDRSVVVKATASSTTKETVG